MAGPPVEVQVRVNAGVTGSVFNWKVTSPGIVTWLVILKQAAISRYSPLNKCTGMPKA